MINSKDDFDALKSSIDFSILNSQGGDKKPPKGFEKFFKKKK